MTAREIVFARLLCRRCGDKRVEIARSTDGRLRMTVDGVSCRPKPSLFPSVRPGEITTAKEIASWNLPTPA